MNTPEEAAALLCPVSRTFAASPAVSGCKGPLCMAWRWERINTNHPLWMPAVRAKAEELGEKAPYPKAALWVSQNLVSLGMVPTKGWCGMGGQP